MFHNAECNAGGFSWYYESEVAHVDDLGKVYKAVSAEAKRLLERMESKVCALGWRIVENDPDDPTDYGYCVPSGQPTTWYPSRYAALMAAADDRSFVDAQMALPLDKPATAKYSIPTTNTED